ncbi:hypothetical protein QCA50_015363 [Cerrena zonata]|uniref:Uncharacterized protein n=1 Tax=Cerrena zonata TaxID=2478898 RepID=A0AAW0FPW9_9APHY
MSAKCVLIGEFTELEYIGQGPYTKAVLAMIIARRNPNAGFTSDTIGTLGRCIASGVVPVLATVSQAVPIESTLHFQSFNILSAVMFSSHVRLSPELCNIF